MKFRELIFFFVLFLSFSVQLCAQTSMTDEQVITFIQKEKSKGATQDQIAKKLMERGVTADQISQIRNKYERQMSGTLLGSKDKISFDDSKDRLRKNNGDSKKNQNFLKQISEQDKSRMQNYIDGLGFAFADSMQADLYDEENIDLSRQVFGRNIFNREKLTFESDLNIATPKDYVLGAGDEIYIDIWGVSQKTIQSTISPEGTILIEDFGPIFISGLTVEQATKRVKSTLGQRYNNSKINLSVGQTKTITIQVMGEVETPGTYTISAFATVFHALYMAGGTNKIGTLRNIKIYRDNKLQSSVDLYDYILNGKLKGNISLKNNDVIIVGTYECLVCVDGKVKRPMFYEMKKDETVGTLLKFSGGFKGDAYKKNVNLTRKDEGELSVFTIDEFSQDKFKIHDGDSLYVDSILPRYKNMVEITGAIFRPGKYELGSKINTVKDLVQMAEGTTESAFLSRVILHRRNEDRSFRTLSLDLDKILKNEIPDIPLVNEDELYIPDNKDLQDGRTMTIYGEVTFPGIYEYSENTSIEDLILQAGGLRDAASLVKVDVSRRIRNNTAIETSSEMAKVFHFKIKDGFIIDGEKDFTLKPYDEVFIRRSPGYLIQQHVHVNGEIQFPGEYVMEKKGQRLSDLIKSAGGITKEAYVKGARLERLVTDVEKVRQRTLLKMASTDSIDLDKLDLGGTRNVGINLDKALEFPGNDKWDIVLRQGDRLIVPQYSNTVSISGEVLFPTTIAYKDSKKLKYYINEAGGLTDNARERRSFVVHMNGTVSKIRNSNDIEPGCEIVVPAKPSRHKLSLTEIMGLGSIAASLVSVIAIISK